MWKIFFIAATASSPGQLITAAMNRNLPHIESGGTRVGSFDAAPRMIRRVCKNGATLHVVHCGLASGFWPEVPEVEVR